MKRLVFALLLLAGFAQAQIIAAVTAECATSVDGSVVGVPNPLNPPVVAAVYSGTLPVGNYFVQIVWYDAASPTPHVTLASPEVQLQLTGTGEIQVSPPASGMPATAVGVHVYIGTTSGSETLQGSVLGAATYTQSVPLIAGAAEPATNNTLCQVIANDAGWPTGTGYQVSFTTPAGQTLPGYPSQWQLLGPGNTINLGNGLPQYNGIVTYPSPILASPYGHAPQSISGPLSIGGYTFTAGAISASGLATLSGGGVLTGSFYGNPIFPGIPNFTTGFQLGGTFGSVGQCPTSTGTGTVWANCASLGGTPTLSASTGAGTGPTLTLLAGSKDKVGGISLTTGSAPATSTILTLTFSTPFATFASCTFSPAGGSAAAIDASIYIYQATSTSSFILVPGTSNLAATTGYQWSYMCNGY